HSKEVPFTSIRAGGAEIRETTARTQVSWLARHNGPGSRPPEPHRSQVGGGSGRLDRKRAGGDGGRAGGRAMGPASNEGYSSKMGVTSETGQSMGMMFRVCAKISSEAPNKTDLRQVWCIEDAELNGLMRESLKRIDEVGELHAKRVHKAVWCGYALTEFQD